MQAHEDGLLSSVPHFNAISKLLRHEDLKDVLQRLVCLSALPLQELERILAVDSTGFAKGCYGTYRESRYGKTLTQEVRRRKWIKLHAICGVCTNIIAAADALDGHSPDSPQFSRLVEKTATGFRVQEVSADKAYSSKANLWYVKEAGGEALIPFRGGKNPPRATARPGGSSSNGATGKHGSARLWRRAFHYFRLREEEFYARYHNEEQRGVHLWGHQATLRGPLKSKGFAAQCNETLCKVVAWNICVLVRAMREHGASPDFQEKGATPTSA